MEPAGAASPLMDESYLADVDGVHQAADAVGELASAAGAEIRQVEAVRIAVTEALGWVLRPDDRIPAGHLDVEAGVSGREFRVVIRASAISVRSEARLALPGIDPQAQLMLVEAPSVTRLTSYETDIRLRFLL